VFDLVPTEVNKHDCPETVAVRQRSAQAKLIGGLSSGPVPIAVMEGFRVLEIAGLEGFVGTFGFGHACLAILMLGVIGLLFLVKYIISL
jgi:hypothetical protein